MRGSRVPRLLSEELGSAIAKGLAPGFEVVVTSFQHEMTSVSVNRHFILRVKLDGEIVSTDVERQNDRELPAVNRDGAFPGALGSVDLIQQAFLRALQQRWPHLAEAAARTELCDYSVHAVGDDKSHQVEVTLTLRLPNGEEWAVREEGVDTIGLTIDGMQKIYHWLAWRLLRSAAVSPAVVVAG